MDKGDLVWFKHKGRIKSGRVVKVHRNRVYLIPSDKAGRRDNVPISAIIQETKT